MEDLTEKRQRILAASRYSPLVEDRFVFGGRRLEPADIVNALHDFVTSDRRARIEDVLVNRTRKVATVVEGVVNMGNVSAVMRSADALGFQPFHVITGGEKFKNSSRTSQGAEKWLDVFHWHRTDDCLAHLRGDGYRILVTNLDETSVPIDEIDFSQRTAVVFGNEKDGVSKTMAASADMCCVIPTVGFVQSFNVSVAAAVGLYHARRDRLVRQGRHGDLTEEQRQELRAVFYLRSVRRADAILAERFEG